MKKDRSMRAAVLIVPALTALLIVSCAINVKKYSRFMPEEMRDCSICHVPDERGLPAERGRSMRADTSGLCAGCHAGRIEEGEHPIGVMQMTSTPLPLTGGVVDCVTCHEPHGLPGNPSMLRLPGPELCSSCHRF